MDFRHGVRARLVVPFSLLFLNACSDILNPPSIVTNGEAIVPQKALEISYCSPINYTEATLAVSGIGQFYYRPTHQNFGLYGNPVAAPIRYAEVVVTNSAGQTIQCGETSDTGSFSLAIPKTEGSYKVIIRSRSGVSGVKYRASVMEDIYTAALYSINTTFSVSALTSSVNVGTISASARQTESAKIEGAAFNILNCIYLANEKIRLASGNSTFSAPRVKVYWRAGFNPNSYFNKPDSLASFYILSEKELYILGGSNGDVKNADTDHFDNSVIIHEYAHFLEDTYGKSESPGGSHDGNGLIDPRLAWSEGWANYFQGAVADNSFYIDTIGFRNDSLEGSGSSAHIAIKFDLSQDARTSAFDRVKAPGEGNFREVSVARSLYKTYSTVFSTTLIGFNKVWNVFTSTSQGFGSSGNYFRSINYFNEFLNLDYSNWSSSSKTAWDSILANEYQSKSRVDYSNPITAAVSCGKYPKAITPTIEEISDLYFYDSASGEGYYNSNPVNSNDYYFFYYDGAPNKTIKLTYTQSGNHLIDLDLILLKNGYKPIDDELEFRLGKSNTSYVARSRRLNPAIENGSESISLAGVAPGYYILNVKAVTFDRNALVALPDPTQNLTLDGTANYELKLVTNETTTEYLCPNF